jgi:dCTP deaminase
MQLSDRSIIRLCDEGKDPPLISPFVPNKVVHPCGFSYGLSSCSYDFRIAEDVILPPNPVYSLMDHLRAEPRFQDDHAFQMWMDMLRSVPCQSQLAYTLEKVALPNNVVGYVVDKSSYARRFVSALNTLFDPGFRGHAVLELVNLSDKPVVIHAGEPIIQMAFHWLDEPALNSYDGKYQDQAPGAHGARYERPEDGSWVESK